MRRDVPPVPARRPTAPLTPDPPAGRRAVPPGRVDLAGVPPRPRSYQRLRAEAGPEEMVLEIAGQPVSKERPRTGKGGHFYTPRKTQQAEEVVAWHARQAGAKCDRHSLFSVDFAFFCGGNRQRDNDNMQKLVQDALNKVVWWDDSQIRHSTVDVVYGSPRPRTVVTIRRLP